MEMYMTLNTFIPEFLKWSSSLELDMSTDAKRGFSLKSKQNGISTDHDETDFCEPSHLDLHCFHRYLFWPVGLKGLNSFRHTPV